MFEKTLKKFERNNPAIAANILYTKGEKILPAYISNHNPTHEKTIILLILSNREKEGWHYLAVKKLSTLLRRVTSKHHGGFYCLSCLHSLRKENKLKSHEKVCKIKDFCGIVIPTEKNKILKFNR